MSRQRINLIPQSRQRARRRWVAMRWCIGGCAGYAMLLLVGCVLLNAFFHPRSSATEMDLTRVLEQIDRTRRDIAAVQAELQAARQNLQAAREISDQPDWSLLLGLLGKTAGEQVVLNGCQITTADKPQTALIGGSAPAARPEARLVQLRGLARSHPEMSQFILRLEQLGLFERVTLVDAGREPIEIGEAVSFQIECVLGGQKERK